MPRRSLARCTMPRQGLEQHHTVAGRKTFAFLVADDGCARISPPHAGAVAGERRMARPEEAIGQLEEEVARGKRGSIAWEARRLGRGSPGVRGDGIPIPSIWSVMGFVLRWELIAWYAITAQPNQTENNGIPFHVTGLHP